MAKNGFVVDWNKERAEKTFRALEGCVLQRPNGQVRYTLLGVEELEDVGWGIRIRAWPKGNTYIYAHNAILEEMVVVKKRSSY